MKEQVEKGVQLMLEGLGIHLEEEGLTETPTRVAILWEDLFSGRSACGKEALGMPFPTDNKGLVGVHNIPFYSICEHHLMPFYGKVHIVYEPHEGRVFGLGRLKKLVDVFAKRPQLQERLTQNIGQSLMEDGGVEGVMVFVEATHLCMLMKGDVAQDTMATTIVAFGSLLETGPLREEALVLLGGREHV